MKKLGFFNMRNIIAIIIALVAGILIGVYLLQSPQSLVLESPSVMELKAVDGQYLHWQGNRCWDINNENGIQTWTYMPGIEQSNCNNPASADSINITPSIEKVDDPRKNK